jgi:hypothetical protein
VLECLEKLAWLESMPQEEWDALPRCVYVPSNHCIPNARFGCGVSTTRAK